MPVVAYKYGQCTVQSGRSAVSKGKPVSKFIPGKLYLSVSPVWDTEIIYVYGFDYEYWAGNGDWCATVKVLTSDGRMFYRALAMKDWVEVGE